MRSEPELQDISFRSKCGFVVLEQSMAATREVESLTPHFDELGSYLNLISALDFGALSLFDRNLAADRLVREGAVAKQATIDAYVQDGYVNDYIRL